MNDGFTQHEIHIIPTLFDVTVIVTGENKNNVNETLKQTYLNELKKPVEINLEEDIVFLEELLVGVVKSMSTVETHAELINCGQIELQPDHKRLRKS
jgi:hypothetical protein